MSNLIKKAGKLGFLIVLVMLANSLRAQDLASTIKLTQGEQFDAAKAAYEKLIAAEPTNGDNYFYLGENYVMSFFADTVTVSLAEISTAAKTVFNKGVEVDPENPLNYIGLAKIALINRDTAAARYLNLAFSKLPSKTNKTSKLTPERQALTYAKAAEALIQTPYKSVAKAEELIEKAAALDTKNPEIYLIWGDVYMENNDGSNAKAKYNLAQDLNPNSPAAKLRVGKLWVRAKNWADAIASYNEAIAIDPNFAPAYVELGAIYLKANQPAKAKEYFEKYLQISPTLSAKLKYLSVLLSLKDWTNAIPVALEIKQADPSRNDINRALAYCYFETKNYPKALESIETFFKNTTPEKIINSDYVYYGDILSKSKKDSLAIIQYNKALEQNPENYDMFSKIADSYKAMKKSDLSIEWYNKKWKLGKMNVADYYKLGSTYYGQAQTLLADSLYKMADSCFAQITKVQPNFQGGKAMLWRGRCNSGLDPESTKGFANPYYDAFIKIAITDSVKNAKDLIEAYKYFQYYYTKLNDYCTAITYIQKIIWTDPEDKYGTDIPMWKDVLTDYGKKCTK